MMARNDHGASCCAARIISHIGKGGRVIVAVRPPGSSVDDVDYRLLGYLARNYEPLTGASECFLLLNLLAGQVSKVDQVQRALCLVNPGDQVIQEILGA